MPVEIPAGLLVVASRGQNWADWLDRLPRLTADLLAEWELRVDGTAFYGNSEDFVADPATDGRLIHTDLHYENMLAAEREPWLVIDPKPLSGDPHFEVAPLIWNRWDEVVASGDLRFAVRQRFHTAIDAAGLDEDRARDWVIVRQLLNVLWTLEDAGGDQSLPQDWLTRNIAIVKAIQH